MSDESEQLLVAFSKQLHEKHRYLAGVSKRYSNTELSANSAQTVESIVQDFEKLLAKILYESNHTSSDPYVLRLMRKETNRRNFLCEDMPIGAIQMSLF